MTELPSPAPVLELILAFRRSKTMFAAVSLGVFDRLEKRAADLSGLAEELNLNKEALERLLNACVALGFLKQEHGLYSNTDLAATYLTRSNPNTLAGYILYSDRALYPLWGNLQSAIRQGTNRWGQTFGSTAPIFEQFFRTEDSRRDFLSGMHAFGRLSSPAVVAAFDLSRFRRLVDLGGATGHLAMAACARYPQLQGVVFDLPAAIATAREYVREDAAARALVFIEGNFFADSLPEADVFALGRILHDWSEEKGVLLLKKIWERLPHGGALLIAEKLLNNDKTGPLPALMQCLSMLVCAEGKERTLAEYTALLRQAGFARIEAKVTDSPLDAILAVKE